MALLPIRTRYSGPAPTETCKFQMEPGREEKTVLFPF